jgi:pimeloyl-ACP methyl ester carboxylesterase
MSAAQLFADDTPVTALGLEERSRSSRDSAVVRDVRFIGADGRPVAAFLIGPAQGSPVAGILFLHWLGEDRSSRDEFVDEAVALAGQRIESLLITQRFPWAERPKGIDHDRVAIGFQVRTTRRALTVLAADAGQGKLALVGHDYGAMHGLLAASVDDRLAAVVAMTPDATWVNWFVKYFHVPSASEAGAYAAAAADLDPATRIGAVRAPLLVQFGTSDVFITSDAVQALTKAGPAGTDVRQYDTDHRLDTKARTDRDAWLLEQLRIGPTSS